MDDVLMTPPRIAGSLRWVGDGVRALRIWIEVLGMDRARAGSAAEVVVGGLLRLLVAIVLAPLRALADLLGRGARAWLSRSGVLWW